MMGFFKPKLELTNHSEPFEKDSISDQKVILLLVDALREDFVEFDSNAHLYLDADASYAYKGKKLTYFKELRETQADNTILLPLKSEVPTITVVRIKSFLTGALSTFYDVSEEFGAEAVKEDTILWQLKNKKNKKDDKIVFYGDFIWDSLFDKYFDRS